MLRRSSRHLSNLLSAQTYGRSPMAMSPGPMIPLSYCNSKKPHILHSSRSMDSPTRFEICQYLEHHRAELDQEMYKIPEHEEAQEMLGTAIHEYGNPEAPPSEEETEEEKAARREETRRDLKDIVEILKKFAEEAPIQEAPRKRRGGGPKGNGRPKTELLNADQEKSNE